MRTAVGVGEVACDLSEKLFSGGRPLVFPGRTSLGFPIIESAPSSRELLLAGWEPDVGFPVWAGATSLRPVRDN